MEKISEKYKGQYLLSTYNAIIRTPNFCQPDIVEDNNKFYTSSDKKEEIEATPFHLTAASPNELLGKILRNAARSIAYTLAFEQNENYTQEEYKVIFAAVKSDFVKYLNEENFPYVLQA